MAETLLSVGLDVGTTSTQMVVSELTIENQASAFAVPELQITDRRVVYRSPVHMTPLRTGELIDGQALRQLVEQDYVSSGITRDQVDTGAIIITGETSRKENARTVLENLSHLAGDFVVATAGPDLESRLAAQGSGAVERSRELSRPVLHMDIGGGTSNLALIRDGRILDTGCLNVGGRLLQFGQDQRITYVSPALAFLTDLRRGDRLELAQAKALTRRLAEILEMGAGLRPKDEVFRRLVTREGKPLACIEEAPVLSFSGGVADCMEKTMDWKCFADLGPLLGQAIRESRLCEDLFFLGKETIRATVIGAGSYSTRLSGSTVFLKGVSLPLQNLPAAVVSLEESDLDSRLRQAFKSMEGPGVLMLTGEAPGDYGAICRLAERLAGAAGPGPLCLCLRGDWAKALGQALALAMGPQAQVLCLDGLNLEEGSYLDVGQPVGPAIPVVIKTLVLGPQNEE